MDTIWLGGGGRTVAATGLEAQWMALAGLRQRRARRATGSALETLIARPPAVLLRSDYRAGQYSGGPALAGPSGGAYAAAYPATVATDGRRWTCMGPLLIDEIARLRRETGAMSARATLLLLTALALVGGRVAAAAVCGRSGPCSRPMRVSAGRC